jgi:predicted nucleotidyltransferase
MDSNLKQIIGLVKKRYRDEGFILLEIFGSYARDEQVSRSDLDLLYELNDKFYLRWLGSLLQAAEY